MKWILPCLLSVASVCCLAQEKPTDAQLAEEQNKLKAITASKGKNSNEYFEQLYQYAILIRQADKFADAEQLLRECISISLKKFGKTALTTRNSRYYLVDVLLALGNYRECAKECQEVITLSQTFTEDQKRIINWAEDLAAALGKANQFQDAIDIYRLTARWRERTKLINDRQYYQNLRNTLDYCFNLNQHDSIPFYFRKIVNTVSPSSTEFTVTMRHWAGYSINRKDYNLFQPIEETWEKFLKDKESRNEKDYPYAEGWLSYGHLLSNRGQVERGLKAFTNAYDVYEPKGVAYRLELMNVVNAITHYCNAQKLYTPQTEKYFAVLEQYHESINMTSAYVDNAWVLATYYSNKNQKPKAAVFLEKALPKAEEVYGKDSKEFVTFKMVLKSLNPDFNSQDVSKEDEQKVIQTLGLNTAPKELDDLNRYLQAGQYAKAIGLFEKSTRLINDYYILKKRYRAYALVASSISLCYRETGNFTKALALLQEATNTVETYMPDSVNMRVIMNMNEGDFYKLIGQNQQAEKKFLTTIKLLNDSQNKENPTKQAENNEMYYKTLSRLAEVYQNMGYYTTANDYFIEIRDYQRKSYGPEDISYANALISLGDISVSLGELGRAERYFDQGLAIIKKTLGENHPVYIKAGKRYASLLTELGNFNQAAPYIKKSKDFALEATGDKSSAYLSSLSDLAQVYTYSGNFKDARVLYLDLLQFHLYRVKNFFPSLSENEKAAFYKSVYGQINAYNWFARKNYANQKEEAGLMYDLQLNTKGLLFKSTNRVKETILSSEDESLKKLYSQWQQEKDVLAKIYQLSPQQKEAAEVNERTQEETVNNIERQLTRQSELFGNLLVSSPTWQAVQKKLAPGEAAIEIVKITEPRRSYSFTYMGKGISYDSAQSGLYYVYNITSDRTPAHKAGIRTGDEIQEINGQKVKGRSRIEVGDILRQEQTVIKLVSEKTSKEYKVTVKRDSVYERSVFYDTRYVALILTPEMFNGPELISLENGDELENRYARFYQNAIKQKLDDPYSYQQFWARIKTKLANTKKVYFSPDGVYNFVNINTLYNPTSGQYVLDETEVAVVNSTADILVSKPSAKIKQATLIGFPDYNNKEKGGTQSKTSLASDVDFRAITADTTSTRFMSSNGVNELQGTKTEVNTIEEILKGGNIAVTKLMSAQATEQQLKTLKTPDVLHVATHGFFLDERAVSGQNQERGLTGVSMEKLKENPLLRSGLLLAGAGHTIMHGKDESTVEDGILTAYEAMNLNLNGTSLVVLSACETGLGQLQSGEGVYGLNRAFRAAGANSVLMSLWKVDDAATQQLMTEFYNEWLKGKSRKEAFRAAQLKLRLNYAHPYYWGAFLMVE